MMSSIYFLSEPLSEQERAERVFQGDILIFKNIPGMHQLCSFADQMTRSAFAPHDPLTAHAELSFDEYLSIVEPLQRKFTNDPDAKKLFIEALVQCGVDPNQTFCDWFPMRIQPGRTDGESMSTAGLHAHRDTWYSNMFSQHNWWAPLYRISPENTLAFFPRYFSEPLENNSKGWDLMKFRAARRDVRARNGSAKEVRDAYPAVEPATNPDSADGIAIAIEPSDIICFSAAHLHASVPNSLPTARFSTELRTINVNDQIEGRGAPNIDGLSTSDAVEDFFRMTDDTPLRDVA